MLSLKISPFTQWKARPFPGIPYRHSIHSFRIRPLHSELTLTVYNILKTISMKCSIIMQKNELIDNDSQLNRINMQLAYNFENLSIPY